VADDLAELAAEALYGAPVSAFVAERKRLAADAKAAGDKVAAAAIAKLAKPSVSAWVVNALLREGALGPLFAAAKRVREGELAASADQRAAMTQLRARAGQLLSSDDHAVTPAVIQRITTTLQAIAAIGTFAPDAPGRLIADRDPPGFEAMAGVTMAPGPVLVSVPVQAPGAPMEPPKPAQAQLDRTRLERAAAAARQVLADRHADLRRLRDELGQAESAASRLRERVAGIEAEVAEAEARAAEAQVALDESVR
jgi:hypothetical protein